MCSARRNPMLHYLDLGQFQSSCPIFYTLFGSLQTNVHNTDSNSSRHIIFTEIRGSNSDDLE